VEVLKLYKALVEKNVTIEEAKQAAAKSINSPDATVKARSQDLQAAIEQAEKRIAAKKEEKVAATVEAKEEKKQ
jgi:hypothetical protein